MSAIAAMQIAFIQQQKWKLVSHLATKICVVQNLNFADECVWVELMRVATPPRISTLVRRQTHILTSSFIRYEEEAQPLVKQ
jgi:hypothetical protein